MNEQLTLDIEGINTLVMEDNSEQDRNAYREASLAEKIEYSKKIFRLASDMSKTYYKAPLIVTYSGGKDSDVLLSLAEECLESDEFEVLNSHTSVDAPETVYHIRETFKRLSDKGIKATVFQPHDKNGNPITMWNLIPIKQMPPTRLQRYCCKVLKETSTPNRICAVGVRESESSNRKGRDIFNTRGKKYSEAKFFSFDHAQEVHKEAQEIQDDNWDCILIKNMKDRNDVVVNPIYYWSDEDIWQYIKDKGMKVNPLYQKGYLRVGCIGCPLATYKQVMKQFSDHPTYKQAYINAFERMLELKKIRDAKGGQKKFPYEWKDGKEVFDWWIEEWKRNVKGQMSLFDEE